MREKVISFLNNEITLGKIPGSTISISIDGEKVMSEGLGNRAVHPKKSPMELDTLFDLASLTKVVATLPAILKLMDEGKICLGSKVSEFYPEFAIGDKAIITLKHLLTHTSGLPAHEKFYMEKLAAKEILQRICDMKLEFSPGTKVSYSDIGYILLSKIIEKVTGEQFQVYLKREIFIPLEMNETGFNLAYEAKRFAATEYDRKLGDYKYGVVHDENAALMNGVSGHAGLFSTLGDLEKFALMIENGGVYGGKRILSESAIALSSRSHTSFDLDQRGIGWMLKSDAVLSAGDYFSNESFGHTGFTGTSIWFDPMINLHVIFLTNSVHFGRDNFITGLRARLHNLIIANY